MPGPFGVMDALLVIDMQNSFCHPDGVMYDALGAPLANIGETVKATAAAVAAARAADGAVSVPARATDPAAPVLPRAP